MPARVTPVITDHYYHVFNRGVARMPVFYTASDYRYMLRAFEYYRFSDVPLRLSQFLHLDAAQQLYIKNEIESKAKTLISVVAFTLMPNHFHLILRQNEDKGIALYMGRAINSYARYLNTKRKRVGPLFQGVYKAVRIESNEQLLHLSRYIHLNPFVGGVIRKEAVYTYPWSSLQAYVGTGISFLQPEIVLCQFSNTNMYQAFVNDHADYAKQLAEIKFLIKDDEGITEV